MGEPGVVFDPQPILVDVFLDWVVLLLPLGCWLFYDLFSTWLIAIG